MKKVLLTVLVAAFSLGCAVTDYPVIFNTSGADDLGVMQGQYDPAYIVSSAQVATIWSNGSDNLFTVVSQDWEGDQWLKTYNNFDPTASVLFLNQTYCDPAFDKTNCAVVVAWNPDIPADNVFDYTFNTSCSGARSLSLLVSNTSRIGECGSGVWADRQGAAYEFSNLAKANYHGQSYYHIPVDNTTATFQVTGGDGAVSSMPVYGRFNTYLNDQLGLAVPMTPNMRYQLNWLQNWTSAHGSNVQLNLQYGALNANFNLNVRGVAGALNRL